MVRMCVSSCRCGVLVCGAACGDAKVFVLYNLEFVDVCL